MGKLAKIESFLTSLYKVIAFLCTAINACWEKSWDIIEDFEDEYPNLYITLQVLFWILVISGVIWLIHWCVYS